MSNFQIKSKYVNTDEINSSIATITNLNVSNIAGNAGPIIVNSDMNLQANYLASQTAFHDYIAHRTLGKITFQDNIEVASTKTIKVDSISEITASNRVIFPSGIKSNVIIQATGTDLNIADPSSTINTIINSDYLCAPNIIPYFGTNMTLGGVSDSIIVNGSLKVDSIYTSQTGNVQINDPLRLTDVIADTAPLKLLTHDINNTVAFTYPSDLTTRSIILFDDFPYAHALYLGSTSNSYVLSAFKWLISTNTTTENLIKLIDKYKTGYGVLDLEYDATAGLRSLNMTTPYYVFTQNGTIELETRIKLNSFASLTDTFQFGLSDYPYTLTGTNYGNYYVMADYVYGTNPAIRLICKNGGAVSTSISLYFPNSSFLKLKIILYSNKAELYLNNVLECTVNSFTMTTTQDLLPIISYSKNQSLIKGISIDYVKLSQQYAR